jgi:hypothetical protein
LEEEASQESGIAGPCLEYLLQHRLMDLLAILAFTDYPPGVRQFTLCFIRKFITQLKHPVLAHVGVYGPIQVSRKYLYFGDGEGLDLKYSDYDTMYFIGNKLESEVRGATLRFIMKKMIIMKYQVEL